MGKIHFLIAPDSFKESMTALEAAQAIARGLKKAYADQSEKLEITQLPLADGGEGTLAVIAEALQAEAHTVEVMGPLGEQCIAQYDYSEMRNLAIIEVATACGLYLIPRDKRNPLQTTTYGVGELVQDALKRGAKKILFALGGTATNDCGVGMLAALGAIFYNLNGQQFTPYSGADLGMIAKINLQPVQKLLADIELEVACDVDNPVIGERGATNIFARQKGATSKTIQRLEHYMQTFVPLLEAESQKKLATTPKTGAAGGLGAALLAIDAKMKNGSTLLLELLRFEQHLQQADYVITGEGSIDSQTSEGKIISGVAKIARQYQVPVIVIAGKVDDHLEALYCCGVTAIFGMTDSAKSLEQALADGAKSLEKTAENIGRLVKNSRTNNQPSEK